MFETFSQKSLFKKHVMITGGSSGIGLCVGEEVAKRGANVTLLARDTNKLEEAKEKIQKAQTAKANQMVQTFSVDVCDADRVANAVSQAESEFGPVFMLVNSAGYSIPAKCEDIKPKDFQRQIEVNFLGSAFVTRAVLPAMKGSGSGHIVFVSSQAGLIGLYGFTAYSASKFALRGFAEALHMEVKPYNIAVTLCFPPDTDTPGFAEEEKNKPQETREICNVGGLVKPSVVAEGLVKDALNRRFLSTLSVSGYVLTTVCAGAAPVSSICELVTQVCFMGPLRLITAFTIYSFDAIVSRCKTHKNESKKEE